MNRLVALLLLAVPAVVRAEGPVYVDVGPALGSPAAFPHAPNAVVRAAPHRRHVPSDIPSSEERDAVFRKVDGLERHIASFDELDRDLLYIRSRQGNLGKLTGEYPAIPSSVLSSLVSQVGKAPR